MSHPIEIAPSILNSDFSRLGEELLRLEQAGCDRIHFDVMDGVFVPNLTIGAPVIASCRPRVSLPFEAHRMIVDPERSVAEYVSAGCELILVHAEATRHLHRTLSLIKDLGARAGVVLNPASPLSMVEYVMGLVDVLMIMSVNPGFGGQRYLEEMDPKLTAASALRDALNPAARIEVDGGISAATVYASVLAGAEVVVSGSALFRDEGDLTERVAEIRTRAEAARAAREHS